MDLQQNTSEWEEFRKDKVGASDAPVIMGVSPYNTPYQLWQKKLSLVPDKENWAMKVGKHNEPLARKKLEEMTGCLFSPQVKLHSEHKWMMASIDAIDIEGKMIVEIKCPGKEEHDLAQSGSIPEKYFPQLQHQMEVCEKEKAMYFSFFEGKGVIVIVHRDDKYIKGMLAKEQEFMEYINELVAPPLAPRDYREVQDDQWIRLANEWKSVSQELSSLEQKEKQVRDRLIAFASGQNTAGGGIKLSRQVRKGNVEYAKIPELKQIDLEEYRKPPVEYWKILTN